VSIALPDDSHRDVAIEAVEMGKHVLLEKPIASRLEDGLAIARVAEASDRVFMVGHNVRFDARYALAQAAVHNGEIGELLYVSCRRNSTVAGAERYRDHTDTHIHLMIHDADYINWIAGAAPARVFSKCRRERLTGWGLTDVVIAMVEYSDGMMAVLEACWAMPAVSPTQLDDRMEIVGKRGVIHLDSCDRGIQIVSEAGSVNPDSRYWPEINEEVGGTLLEELTSFVACVEDGRRPIVGAREALAALAVVDAIGRSLAEGREVTVDPAALNGF
jgi:UDP-N-acetylglucosamine 3-dehydrogenase